MWRKLLAMFLDGKESLLYKQIDYLREENRTLKSQIKGRPKLNNEQRKSLARKGIRLGELLKETISIVQPDTLLKWHRELVRHKQDYSHPQRRVGRPSINQETKELVLKMARENPSWGYDRIQGALKNLKINISDQSVANILREYGLEPSPKRRQSESWSRFIKRHKDMIWATDFFTSTIWTSSGLSTFYILFFINLKTKQVHIAGITEHPDGEWMKQVARNITAFDELPKCNYLIHDRDTKYTKDFDDILKSSGIQTIKTAPMTPNMNAYAERFVRSIKEECLNQMIIVGESGLRYCIKEYVKDYHKERNHQSIDIGNKPLFPDDLNDGDIQKSERLGGLLNYY